MEISQLLYGLLLTLIAIAAVVGLLLFVGGMTRETKRNGLTISGAIMACFSGLLYLILSPSGSSEITSEIEGTYKFQFPKGQVEILSVKNDRTFNQAIYSNEADFSENRALYNNSGSWSTTGEQIGFDHWLSICYLGRNIDSILVKPEISTMTNVYWHSANSEHNALMDIWSENGYVLEKIAP